MLLLEGISQLYKFKLIVQNVISPGWVPKYVNGGGGRNSRFVEIYKESSLPKIFPPLVLHNYSSMYTVFVENTGHSIKIDLRSDDEECEQGDLPAISGSLLQVFAEFNKLNVKAVGETTYQSCPKSIKIWINPNKACWVKANFQIGRYILKNVHFHWEADHVINGRMFPLEGHFVHLPENPDSGDTSVVLSVFYET
ncbi:unnamed protein product [Acanthoscelides obtectus]|uniref:carbonic anhydrase n=1 Tax=Acanthoscelides obtectus TaxID=200917 RepID=A0A9P0Q0G4_ACAOB|nr:unnamed protein product [Acanthoscelides obtectus]CAK1649742.1 hypothetical protein AOBTE_LOCUS16395 [Acanthoscelides obtectus]